MSDKKSTEKKTVKKRNWAFVLYPESAPENWVDMLKQTGVPCAISPLHDRDLKITGAETDEGKKAHYHVILAYSGPTTYNVVSELTARFNATIPVALEAVRGYYRYLTHKDDPDKHQYDDSDIQHFNGFNIANYIELTRNEVNVVKRQLQMLIREHNIVEYSVLMDYLLDGELYLEHDIASSNTTYFTGYIRSRRHAMNDLLSLKPMPAMRVDRDTGEILE